MKLGKRTSETRQKGSVEREGSGERQAHLGDGQGENDEPKVEGRQFEFEPAGDGRTGSEQRRRGEGGGGGQHGDEAVVGEEGTPVGRALGEGQRQHDVLEHGDGEDGVVFVAGELARHQTRRAVGAVEERLEPVPAGLDQQQHGRHLEHADDQRLHQQRADGQRRQQRRQRRPPVQRPRVRLRLAEQARQAADQEKVDVQELKVRQVRACQKDKPNKATPVVNLDAPTTNTVHCQSPKTELGQHGRSPVEHRPSQTNHSMKTQENSEAQQYNH